MPDAPVIGILEAGENRPELAARHGTYADFFETYFRRHDAGFACKAYAAYRGELPSRADACDGYVIAGSRHSSYDDFPWIAEAKTFVRSAAATRPVLGICFGHQLVAEAHGGEVAKSPKGWGVGVHDYEVYVSRPWMNPPVDRLSLLVSHQDQVTTPPPGAETLASSDFCPIGMMAIGDNILTLQSHPEMTKPFVAELYAARREQIGSDRVDDALTSLEVETNEDVAAAWMSGFLRRSVGAAGVDD